MERTERGNWVNGQRRTGPFGARNSAVVERDWFAQACLDEDAGRLHQAMRAYRRALDVDGASAVCCFNLGNVLYGLRRKIEAAECFRQAVTLDAHWHEAWNNLGVVRCDLSQCEDAAAAFQRAMALAPGWTDPLFNLADCCDERGLTPQAQRLWRDYAALDTDSEWGQYALARLEA